MATGVRQGRRGALGRRVSRAEVTCGGLRRRVWAGEIAREGGGDEATGNAKGSHRRVGRVRFSGDVTGSGRESEGKSMGLFLPFILGFCFLVALS
jgi:hypothetical protein